MPIFDFRVDTDNHTITGSVGETAISNINSLSVYTGRDWDTGAPKVCCSVYSTEKVEGVDKVTTFYASKIENSPANVRDGIASEIASFLKGD
jgi:hypothetical protein